MSEAGNKRVHLAAIEQQQPLIDRKEMEQPPLPPTYAQATKRDNGPTITPAISPGPTVVVVNEPVPIYGPHPIDVQCPYCHNFCRTRLHYTATPRTHLIALLLCVFQLYCCICLPYCIKSCMNVSHYCGMCNKYLGTYHR